MSDPSPSPSPAQPESGKKTAKKPPALPVAIVALGAFELAKVVPAWLISLGLHAGLLTIMATVTWSIEKVPEPETTVGVVMSSRDEKGKVEYLTRDRIEMDKLTKPESLASQAIEQSTVDALQEMGGPKQEVVNVIGVEGGTNISSTEFSAVGLSSGYNGPSSTFGGEIAKLKKVGLNIVIVFDSTGSMDKVIRQTQQQIDKLMETVSDLVPKTRIALVTYRDHGEDYVTKSLPFTNDRIRVREWLFSVKADGGGDMPEAVDKGLEVAMKMSWQKRAKRIILLFGDAEPHPKTVDAVLAMCKRFHEGGGMVSTIVTDPGGPANGPFEQIAQAGGGECYPLGNSKEIVKKLLVLAFGSQWENHITEEFKKRLESP